MSVAEIEWLDRDEYRAMFDRQTQALLGLSADEFIRLYDTGAYEARRNQHTGHFHDEVLDRLELLMVGAR